MMIRFNVRLLFGAAIAFGSALTPARAQHDGHAGNQGDLPHDDKAASQTPFARCPVTDEPINLAVGVQTADGPIFFCCKDCISKYQAKPAKYSAKVAEQRKSLADRPKTQVICPVSKDPVDQDISVESGGRKVYFCCKSCINQYRADPAKYASALANSFSYQTKCPVMGGDIDPKAFTTVSGGKPFYFCCDGCEKKFFKDPEKYTPNLTAQGFIVNPKEMVHGADEHAGHDHGADGHDH
ncbi:MAG TPA: YHS domain-containing protein [Phycisphaerae bacterium]|nr:YHS domain-containing protein [Phycisphaerae bacterium]